MVSNSSCLSCYYTRKWSNWLTVFIASQLLCYVVVLNSYLTEKEPSKQQYGWAHRSCGSAEIVCSAGLLLSCFPRSSWLLSSFVGAFGPIKKCERRRAWAGVSTATVNTDVDPDHIHTAFFEVLQPSWISFKVFLKWSQNGWAADVPMRNSEIFTFLKTWVFSVCLCSLAYA